MKHSRLPALAVAGFLLLTSCASQGAQTNSPDGGSTVGGNTSSQVPAGSSQAPAKTREAPAKEVKLVFWGTYGNGGNSAQTTALGKLIPKFEAANPGVTVEYVDMPYDGLKQALTTSAAGGELPDLIRSDIGWVAQLAELGVYKQLDGQMPGFEDLSSKVFPGALKTTSWNGHYYGLPLNTNTRVLVSNPKALKAAGLTKPPATFEELKAMAGKLKGKNISVFADGGLGAWNVMPWIWSAGGDIADEALTTSTGYLDSDASVEGMQLLVDLYKEEAIPNLITGNQGGTSTSDGLPAGKYATILDGPWMKDIWTGQYPDFEPVYSPVPAGKGGSISVVGGESIVVTETTQNAAAAFKFVEFTQSEDYQLGMASAGQMSVKPEYSAAQAKANPYFKTFSDQLETARARLPIPKAGEVDTILSTELLPAFEGTKTVKEALSSAAKQIDALLAEGQ